MHTIEKQNFAEIQQKIFRRLESQLKRESPFTLVNTIQDLLNIGKTAAYNKMYARSPLKMSELLILIQQFDFKLEDFLSYRSSPEISFHHSPGAFNEDVQHDTLAKLKKELCMIRREDSNYICNMDPGIPIFLLLKSPELMHFTYLAENLLYRKNGYKTNKEHLNQDISTKTKVLYHQLSEQFNSLDSDLIIGPNPFDNILAKIDYLNSMLLMEKSYALRLIQHLQSLLQDLEKANDPGDEVVDAAQKKSNRILICDALLLRPTLLVRIEDTYLVFHDPIGHQQLTSSSFDYGREKEKMMKQLINHSWHLAGASLSTRRRFFSSILERIRQSEKKIREIP